MPDLVRRARNLKIFSNLRGDILGGITTSVISLPLALAFGIAAFAPLGPEYVAQGALAGLFAAIVAGILASVFGGTPSQITGPTAPMSVFIAALIVSLMKDKELAAAGAGQVQMILLLVAATIILGGLFQVLLGLVGGGKLIKYIPYPVVAGFMNGIAILIFLAQLQPFFGVDKSVPLISIFTGQGAIHYETVIVGLVTIAAMVLSQRFIKAIPSALTGVICGIAAYFIIGNLLSPGLLATEANPLVIGPVPSAVPTPTRAFEFFSMGSAIPIAKWGSIILPALMLCVLATIDTLLTSVVADVATKTKHNSNRELIGQGIGNIGSALFGGISAAGSTTVTMVNISSGGRTPLSGCVKAVTVLLIILALSPFVRWIPLSVLAGTLMVVAVKILDYNSFRLFRKKSTIESVVVMLIVTVITVTVDLMIAVGIGLIIACLLFVKEHISKSIIRRKYSGDSVHSKKVRTQGMMRILEDQGHRIRVYELCDSLFFGTCDKLLAEIETDTDRHCIVLDLKRVNTIDLTGAQLIRQVTDRIQEKGHHLLLSYLDVPGDSNKDRIRNFMEDLDLPEIIGRDHIFPDTDHALEWCEDLLIREAATETGEKQQLTSLEDMPVFRTLPPDRLKKVEQYIKQVSFKQGDIIFKEGDPGDGIYFILSGYVSIYTGGRSHRLTTFAEGVFFGEMSLFDDQRRSATVRAEIGTELLFMSKNDFQQLGKSEPLIAAHILTEIARELSNRLRLTNAEVRALEE